MFFFFYQSISPILPTFDRFAGICQRRFGNDWEIEKYRFAEMRFLDCCRLDSDACSDVVG